MSSYTMQLRTMIEQATQNQTLSTRDRIEEGRKKLFDFDYPIFDPNYKKIFETHFIRTFYMREIGFETEGLFKFNLETWLIVNMPYFNKLFESELMTFDPLKNTELNTTQNKKTDSTSSSSANGSQNTTASTSANAVRTDDDFSRSLSSDNPDSRLALTANDGEGVIQYANKIEEDTRNNESTNNTSSNASGNTTDQQQVSADVNTLEDYVQQMSGKIGSQSYSKLLEEYRSTFIRIEKQIFNEMQELFMLVY